MNVVRLIVVKVNPAQAKEAENIWKQHCAPLMIKEPVVDIDTETDFLIAEKLMKKRKS